MTQEQATAQGIKTIEEIKGSFKKATQAQPVRAQAPIKTESKENEQSKLIASLVESVKVLTAELTALRAVRAAVAAPDATKSWVVLDKKFNGLQVWFNGRPSKEDREWIWNNRFNLHHKPLYYYLNLKLVSEELLTATKARFSK